MRQAAPFKLIESIYFVSALACQFFKTAIISYAVNIKTKYSYYFKEEENVYNYFNLKKNNLSEANLKSVLEIWTKHALPKTNAFVNHKQYKKNVNFM